MKCIYCFKEMKTELSWENIILGSEISRLCILCHLSFVKLKTPLCKICSTESKILICNDCKAWSNKFRNYDVLTRNYSIFKYNAFIQKYLAQWKYQGDYILIEGLMELIITYIKQDLNFIDQTYTIIPIPLSEKRLKERAFNQATLLAQAFGKIDESYLSRKESKKQSKKTKEERIKTTNSFKIHKKIQGKVLLVDDIYTTGTTIRHAAALLIENGASEVSSFTLIRS